MLKILMLLLTFTDFELSGQNIEPEAKSVCKFKQLNFMIHMGTIYYVYLHMRKNKKPVRSENL